MKKWLYIIVVFSIYSCCPGGVSNADYGPLPESALGFVPYLDDSIYSFKHSDGSVIHYQAIRETNQDWSHCADCCFEFSYEKNTTRMVPDQQIFEIIVEISNEDTVTLSCVVQLAQYFFTIPTEEEQYPNFEMVDSLLIGTTYYYDVFKLGSPQHPYTNNDPVKMDSLYYNYGSGILKIIMSDGGYYQLIPPSGS